MVSSLEWRFKPSRTVAGLREPPLNPERLNQEAAGAMPKGDRLVKLTDKNIRTLPSGKSRTNYTDSSLPGFVLRVSSSGHRSFSVMYGSGKARTRYTIGPLRELTLAQARDRAREILAKARLGEDPQAAKIAERRKPDTGTLAELAERFMEAKPRQRGGQWRPATGAIYRHALDHYILPRFGRSDPATITRQEIRLFLDGIARKTPTMANRVLETFRRCYSWALSRDYVAATPFTGIERPAPKTRATRTFSNDEIRTIFASVRGTQLEHLVPLIFHTATRSEETRSMRWPHVDLERAVWHIPATQTEAGQDLPLSKGAMAILQRIREAQQRDAKVVPIASPDFVFPAPTGNCDTCGLVGHMDKPNKSTATLKEKLGLDDRGFLHHIRRTVADRLKNDLGFAPFVVDAVLGHAQPDLAKTYMPTPPAVLMRGALQRWSDELAVILKEKRPARRRK
jgi:integrase